MKKQDAKREMNFSLDLNEKLIKKFANSLKVGDAIVCQLKNGEYEMRYEKNYLENMLAGGYETKTETEKTLLDEFFAATVSCKLDIEKLLHGYRNAASYMTTVDSGEKLISVILLKGEALQTDKGIADITNNLKIIEAFQMPTLIYVVDKSLPFRMTKLCEKLSKRAA